MYENTQTIITAVVCIHNFLIKDELQYPCTDRIYNEKQDEDVNEVLATNGLNDNVDAETIRENLKQYFVRPEGRVGWQYNSALRNL